MRTRYTPEDFARDLTSAVHVGQKIEALSVRVEDLAHAFKEVSRKIDQIAMRLTEIQSVGPTEGEGRLLYTTKQAAHSLSISTATVRMLIAQGYLRATKSNGRLQRIHRKDLEALAKIGIPSVWESKPWKEERNRGEK
jgi:excisionase family DNA binding protein